MKPLNPIWKYFDRNSSNPSNVKATCKGCKVEFQGMPKRLEKHVEICKKLDNFLASQHS